jgi:alkanesulfonate monooxygenase SsuD/methylene tetrahydromethanopterin reductase-like flavin-dependent oxidoreductase (luciferase family)
MIGDDVDVARNAMRPMLALYVGGMGSREQNFYNRLVSSYGFEAAARQVQELYLAGKRSEAAMTLPDELIDQVTITGTPDRARERIRAYRDAGVHTLIVSPMTLDADEATKQLRLVAELNQELG